MGKFLWNIVNPIKQCYGSEKCYGLIQILESIIFICYPDDFFNIHLH